MLRPIKNDQRLPRLVGLRVQGTGTAAILEGQHQHSITDNGTGDYTITFGTAFKRVPACAATPLTADAICRIKTVTASAVTIECLDATDGTTPKDADLHLICIGWDAEDEI